MNKWLHDLSNAWKMKYNIKEERDISIKQEGKGSVWLNLQKRAMYEIKYIVQNTMLKVYAEYIIYSPIKCTGY